MKGLTVNAVAAGAVAAILFLAPGAVGAYGAYVIDFHGMGVSGDFAKGHVADNGAYLAYKNGFFSSLSFFWSGEAGYRFVDKSCHARAGIDAMFLFVGIQTGIILAYQPDHARDYTQGAYAGIGGAIPIGRKAAWFLFTGGQFFLDRAWEFYVSTSVVFNLFG